jgi:hypothetical protein
MHKEMFEKIDGFLQEKIANLFFEIKVEVLKENSIKLVS